MRIIFGLRFGAMMIALLSGLAMITSFTSPTKAQARNKTVYTVAGQPVDEEAADAVTAKTTGVARAKEDALHLLLKRLTPYWAHARLPKATTQLADRLLDGISVRRERTSATRYIATLDLSFQPDRVRELLRKANLPVIDRQSPVIMLVPVFRPAAAGSTPAAPNALTGSEAAQAWRSAFATLDLKHAVTPLRLAKVPKIAPAEIDSVLAGNVSVSDRLGLGVDYAVLAVATPDPAAGMVYLDLVGADTIGPLTLKQRFAYTAGDIEPALWRLSEIALGVIEGRWKETQPVAAFVPPPAGGAATGNGERSTTPGVSPGPQPGASQTLFMTVAFSGLRQWQAIRQKLNQVPGINDLQVNSITARGADIQLAYPGPPDRLARQLTAYGLGLASQDGGLVLFVN